MFSALTYSKKNWDLDALTDYKGATLQYKDVARKIEKLHILLEESGIKPGDKVALCGRNSSHWGVAFLAILTYGAVAVSCSCAKRVPLFSGMQRNESNNADNVIEP